LTGQLLVGGTGQSPYLGLEHARLVPDCPRTAKKSGLRRTMRRVRDSTSRRNGFQKTNGFEDAACTGRKVDIERDSCGAGSPPPEQVHEGGKKTKGEKKVVGCLFFFFVLGLGGPSYALSMKAASRRGTQFQYRLCDFASWERKVRKRKGGHYARDKKEVTSRSI